ncbi:MULTISPECIES: sigma-70 family RNA polymerase sigma factor [unclassified Pseudomonas]|uniref:sigma-70 family RNA polymerase sigma factor n=1 Tax=unclassified Pseudomonas TaxID=196821 RepID=UPI002446C701|nr:MULTISPECIES: sigma-70 family RNA polymerase sigma factor [unclassified Pseudomonas]MDH0892935.1 sigma-70 family RNA polymerase sigma factor [Pseudomonas sp. GD03875]MDH1064591.1 sigma-70 family RNA polymerase sigma factor [Pseudomonas sp. GD03985]
MTGSATSRQQDLQRLYHDHHGWLQGWLRKRMDCSQGAADLAQDTFLRLLGKERDPAPLRDPRAYLSTIAHSLLVNHWRRLAVERAYLESLALQPERYAPSPEERELIMATLLQIDAMLRRLPGKVRDTFLMAQLDGLIYATIAGRLGVSERMVKKYMAQAMLHCLTLAED